MYDITCSAEKGYQEHTTKDFSCGGKYNMGNNRETFSLFNCGKIDSKGRMEFEYIYEGGIWFHNI